jgi:hypothetical protein
MLAWQRRCYCMRLRETESNEVEELNAYKKTSKTCAGESAQAVGVLRRVVMSWLKPRPTKSRWWLHTAVWQTAGKQRA